LILNRAIRKDSSPNTPTAKAFLPRPGTSQTFCAMEVPASSVIPAASVRAASEKAPQSLTLIVNWPTLVNRDAPAQ